MQPQRAGVSVCRRVGPGGHDPTRLGVVTDEPGVLDDGSYDALVVDATPEADGSCLVELAIVAGPHKGEVVSFRAAGLGPQALDLLGVPATLTVAAGAPSVVFEPGALL